MSRRWIQRAIAWAGFWSPWRRYAILLAFAVLMLGGYYLSRPVWDSFRGWRAARLVKEADGHVPREDWEEVLRTAKASLQIQGSIDALRHYVRAAQKTGDPYRLHPAVILFGHPEATSADRTGVIKAFVDANDLIAVAELLQLLRKEDYDPEMRFQVVRFLVNARPPWLLGSIVYLLLSH